MSWTPIISCSHRMAENAWESIGAIADDVFKQRYQPTNILPRRYSTYEEAMLFAYMARGTANCEWEKRCLERLNDAIGQATGKMPSFALYGGLCGLGWTVEHVSQILGGTLNQGEFAEALIQDGSPDEDPNEEIDSALIERLHLPVKRGLFDLINGLVGFGVYFLERWPRGRSIEGLKLVIDALERIAENEGSGTTWHSPPGVMSDLEREQHPAGYYNLGVAHGVPGVVQFLCQVAKTRIEAPRVSSLLDRTLTWLLAQADLNKEGLRFRSWLSPEGNSRVARPVWCYGDLGVAAILLQVTEGRANRTVNAFARDMLETCLKLPVESYQVEDAGLCHGATGVAHIYNRIYQVLGDHRFRNAALDWYELALAMSRPGTGVGGYSKCVISNQDGAVAWEPWPAFLDGSIGIALALLGAVTPVEPQWDRAMLLSSRRLSQTMSRSGQSSISCV